MGASCGPSDPPIEPGKPYIYELVPSVEVTDRVGVFELMVTLPGAVREVQDLDLVKDDPTGGVGLQVPVPGGAPLVRNRAQTQGLLIEQAIASQKPAAVDARELEGYDAVDLAALPVAAFGRYSRRPSLFLPRAYGRKATAPVDWALPSSKKRWW